MKLDVYEVFSAVERATTREQRIKILQDNNHHAVRDIIKGSRDPLVVFNLPKGRPPYTPNKPESTPSTFKKQNVKLKNFVVGGPGDQMQGYKREKLFIDLLEVIHPHDAELVLNMIEKKLPAKGLTKKIVEEAYPGLL